MTAQPTTDRVQDLARDMFAIASAFNGLDMEVASAKEALDEVSNQRQQGRMGILMDLAGLSEKHSMTEAEINMTMPRVSKMNNNPLTQKSLETFLADCKVAMHPYVRGYAGTIQPTISEAWAAEAAGEKTAPKPIRKAFKREYHAVMRGFKLARDERTIMHRLDDVTTWAQMNDPDHDPDKVLKQVQALIETMNGMSANFPVSQFKDAVEFLTEVNVDVLKAARHGLLASQEDNLQAHKLHEVPASVVQRVAAAQDATIPDAPDVDALLDNIALEQAA